MANGRVGLKRVVRETPIRVAGFRFGASACGIKPSRRADCAVVVADEPAAVGAVFTRNAFAAAPVRVGQERVADGRLQALVVNSGNANACTGARGLADARRSCRIMAEHVGIGHELVAPLSTGVIGQPLPMARLERGIARAVRDATPGGAWRFARAIRTTDAFSKVVHERVRVGARRATVLGIAKGAGMIAPDMATLLVFLFTDAALSPAQARWLAREVGRGSFNELSVDGDTSTNDSLYVLASGRAGNRVARSRDALDGLRRTAVGVGERLARMVALDGEGATKAVEIDVTGAASVAAARRVAETLSRSLLVKTAFHGADPNWGRIACAVGYSGVAFEPRKVSIAIDDVVVFRGGSGVAGARARARRRMMRDEFCVRVRLGSGPGRARMITSDLSPAYVRFNSAYTT